jgi:beta-lactamase regulating signal transducer with metallopeptidase domain
MGLILLFYHAFLAKEKIYQINRWYLIVGLLFSLIVPFIPIGIADSLLNLGGNTEIVLNGIENINTGSDSLGKNYGKQTSNFEWIYPFLLCLYSIITLFLSLRMIRHLYRMQLRAMKNPATFFNGHKVVLLDEDVVPHTFWKTIFVNREQYENGKISEEVMIHELNHARQNHSLDILIVEILKTICWFNPVLYFYKTAIQVNHEYIADDKVLSSGTDIADYYQTLLLHMRTARSAHYLSTSLNFKITKKRFRMMTQNNSTYRSFLKAAAIIPFFLILGITFGCEPAGMEKDNQTGNINLEIIDSETIKLNGKTVSASEFRSEFSDLSIDPSKVIIDLKVYDNVSTGIVTDVQEVLRENGALRINYSSAQSKTNQTKETWRTKLDNRNILDLYINEEGDIIVNQDRTTLSSVNSLVREFITNNGKSAGLSESPEDAIIVIKTDKRTPHDIYVGAVEKVIEVYDELRNQASVKLFDKPFQSLEEESKERNKIEDMYPRRISIANPLDN